MQGGEAESTHSGSRYLVVHQEWSTDPEQFTSSSSIHSETIVLECPREVSCRFILDERYYRGNSTLFKPQRQRNSIGLEVGPPFWRSDEPERLALLRSDARFLDITRRLQNSAGFAALAVCNVRDSRQSSDSAARRLSGNNDAIMLHRTGANEFHRSQQELNEDLDRMATLRDLLVAGIVPLNLPRAEIVTSRIALKRVLGKTALFFGLLGIIGAIIYFLSP
jgi:hypothetical protein